MAKILVVEDDESLLETICDYLGAQDYIVEGTSNGVDALNFLKSYDYDLIVLDLNIPGIDGISLCESYRARGGKARTLMLTGRKSIESKVQGFDAGADDYLTKPFDIKELGLRVRALMKRVVSSDKEILQSGRLALDTRNHQVTVDGATVALARQEFALLEFLLRNRDEVFSTDALLDKVWRSDANAGPEAVKACVYRIRTKLGLNDEAPTIRSVHGVGYRFESR